jgi:hypothetical protein
VTTWDRDEFGDFIDPPQPPYHCRRCGEILTYRPTPLVPNSGIWDHESKSADHVPIVPWDLTKG